MKSWMQYLRGRYVRVMLQLFLKGMGGEGEVCMCVCVCGGGVRCACLRGERLRDCEGEGRLRAGCWCVPFFLTSDLAGVGLAW